jgi:hypothetical protein
MKRHILIGILYLLAVSFMLASCHREYFEFDRLSTEMELEPGLVAPLLYGSFTMGNLIEFLDSTDYSMEDEAGLTYYLIYADTIFSVDDTTSFETGELEEVVTQLQVNLKTVNELPFYMDLQVYLENENQVVLDSVFDNQGVVLAPAQLDSEGKLVIITEDENSSTFDNEKIGILDSVAFLRVKSRMLVASEGADFVKVYATYSMDYELSLSAKARLKIQN